MLKERSNGGDFQPNHLKFQGIVTIVTPIIIHNLVGATSPPRLKMQPPIHPLASNTYLTISASKC
jgi:hypothetical protein